MTEDKFDWEDAQQPALIKTLTIGESAVVLVFRKPGGGWMSVLAVEPVQATSLADAMEKSEALARQWRRGME